MLHVPDTECIGSRMSDNGTLFAKAVDKFAGSVAWAMSEALQGDSGEQDRAYSLQGRQNVASVANKRHNTMDQPDY